MIKSDQVNVLRSLKTRSLDTAALINYVQEDLDGMAATFFASLIPLLCRQKKLSTIDEIFEIFLNDYQQPGYVDGLASLLQLSISIGNRIPLLENLNEEHTLILKIITKIIDTTASKLIESPDNIDLFSDACTLLLNTIKNPVIALKLSMPWATLFDRIQKSAPLNCTDRNVLPPLMDFVKALRLFVTLSQELDKKSIQLNVLDPLRTSLMTNPGPYNLIATCAVYEATADLDSADLKEVFKQTKKRLWLEQAEQILNHMKRPSNLDEIRIKEVDLDSKYNWAIDAFNYSISATSEIYCHWFKAWLLRS